MSPNATNPLIRVAIIGGGLAGASLMHALVKVPHIDAHIFESASAFKEAGMAIGIARNAQSALELISPSAAECLKRAGAVPMHGVRFMVASGPTAGGMADEVDDVVQGKRLTSIVHRADFLRELLVDIPRDRMHVSKKLLRVEKNDNGDGTGTKNMTLHFADETTHECDILIGADGVHSFVRKLVLGDTDPAACPRNSGAWFLMTLHEFEKAQASLGKDLVDIADAREYGWTGKDTFLMHNILSDGKQVQFAVASTDEEAIGSDQWVRVVRADEIKTLFQDWPLQLKKAIDELLCDKPEHQALYLWDHPNASTYVSGAICITGDAAHSTTPWQGSGGGMSIEDSLVLYALLGRAKNPAEAVIALQVYDQVRRPRTQRIVESSRTVGSMLTGSEELDPETLRTFMSRWDFIINLDVEKHRDAALEMLEAKLEG